MTYYYDLVIYLEGGATIKSEVKTHDKWFKQKAINLVSEETGCACIEGNPMISCQTNKIIGVRCELMKTIKEL